MTYATINMNICVCASTQTPARKRESVRVNNGPNILFEYNHYLEQSVKEFMLFLKTYTYFCVFVNLCV